MILKYNIEIDDETIRNNLNRATNQTFKLLLCREKEEDWQTPLNNLILEIGGLSRLIEKQTLLLSILCKMEMMTTLTEEEDFLYFRKLIFECLNLFGKIKEEIGGGNRYE